MEDLGRGLDKDDDDEYNHHTMKSGEVLEALREYHKPRGAPWNWAFFDEQRIGTGWGQEAQQSMDAWAIHYWPSKQNRTIAYEIKVSRSDFRAEIRNPMKRRPALRLSREFYFAAPAGLIQPEEIPPECGLVEVRSVGAPKVVVVVQAPARDICPPTWNFVASLCRGLWKAEEALKAKTGGRGE